MPEYSGTTITPADGVQVPSMNGSTAGNILLSALKSYMLSGAGQANGLATLGSDGKLTAAQLPDLADDVIVVTTYANLPSPGTAAKIYITADTNYLYRWDPDLDTPAYIRLADLTDYARIEDIQQGYIQAGIAVKAFQDAMGRAIITTYETKADASDLKAAIQFNTKRIENLEQKSGSVVDVDYPDYSPYGEVPTGKARNAIVSKLRGVSVAYNQLLQGVVPTFTLNGVTFTNNEDGSMTLTGTASPQISEELFTQYVSYKANHKYSITGLTTKTGISYGIKGFVVNNPSDFLFTHTSDWSHGIAIKITDGTNTNGVTLSPVISDLTQMFGPSVADYLYSLEQGTAGAGVALFNELIKATDNSAQAGTLVSTTYSAVKSIHKNLLDYSTVSHPSATIVLNDDGSVTVSATYGAVAIEKLLTKTIGSGTYTFSNIAGLQAYVQIGSSSDYSHLVNVGSSYTFNYDGTSYLRILYNNQSSGSTVTYKAQLELGSSSTSYSPYGTLDTLSLPESVTLRGILKVVNNNLVVDGDEHDPETGEIERRYNTKELVSSNVSAISETYSNVVYYRISKIDDYKYQYKYVQDPYLLFSNGLSSGGTGVLDSASNIGKYRTDADMNRIWIGFAVGTTLEQAQAFMNGVNYQYELASPTSDTPIDPILDPTIATEGGGTLSTEQTNDPAIVSAMEMTYLTL